jgi:hypothetical protein
MVKNGGMVWSEIYNYCRVEYCATTITAKILAQWVIVEEK